MWKLEAESSSDLLWGLLNVKHTNIKKLSSRWLLGFFYLLSRNLRPSQLLGGDLCRTEFMVHLFGTIYANSPARFDLQLLSGVSVGMSKLISLTHTHAGNHCDILIVFPCLLSSVRRIWSGSSTKLQLTSRWIRGIKVTEQPRGEKLISTEVQLRVRRLAKLEISCWCFTLAKKKIPSTTKRKIVCCWSSVGGRRGGKHPSGVFRAADPRMVLLLLTSHTGTLKLSTYYRLLRLGVFSDRPTLLHSFNRSDHRDFTCSDAPPPLEAPSHSADLSQSVWKTRPAN